MFGESPSASPPSSLARPITPPELVDRPRRTPPSTARAPLIDASITGHSTYGAGMAAGLASGSGGGQKPPAVRPMSPPILRSSLRCSLPLNRKPGREASPGRRVSFNPYVMAASIEIAPRSVIGPRSSSNTTHTPIPPAPPPPPPRQLPVSLAPRKSPSPANLPPPPQGARPQRAQSRRTNSTVQQNMYGQSDGSASYSPPYPESDPNRRQILLATASSKSSSGGGEPC